jgi:HD-GYP domain-containing protein (c-di-GMP phosphodiesterase class II)
VTPVTHWTLALPQTPVDNPAIPSRRQARERRSMKLIPLDDVRSQLRSGSPLPWGVRDAGGKLLLGKGHVIASDAQLEALVARGMFVDAEEAKAARGEAVGARPLTFAARWNALQGRLASVLRGPTEEQFMQRVGECVTVLSVLGERNADQLIFSIIRHDPDRYASYGITHSLHVASLVALIARRLEWPVSTFESAVGAALTMNLSMIELQGQLAGRGGRPTPAQQQVIDDHPAASAALLREAGLADARWLEAVEQHHEVPGGTGYPAAVQAPGEISQVLRFIDIFLAKHSGRADRAPVPAQQAARDLFVSSNGHPVPAMMIKEFGIYPPGCFVRLANGETAVVVRRGANANTPVVAALTNRNGDPLLGYPKRDTSLASCAVQGTVSDKAVMVRVPAETLFM